MARNQFDEICYLCARLVKAGTGDFELLPANRWRVKHANISGFSRITCEEAKTQRKPELVAKGPLQ